MTSWIKTNVGKSILSGLLVLFIGTVFLILDPPMQVPDEGAHFYRAYAVSTGQFLPVAAYGFYGANVNDAVFHYVRDQAARAHTPRYKFNGNFQPQEHLAKHAGFIEHNNTAAYSPLLYLPAALGINIARLFHLTVVNMFYAARISNLIVFSVLVSLGCYLLRGRYNFLLLLVLLPSSLFLAASVSQDGQLIGLSFLAAAALLAICKGLDGKLARLCLVIALFLVATAKLPYVPLLLLLFVPPYFNRKTWSRRPAVGWTIIPFLVTITYALIWYAIVKNDPIAGIMASASDAAKVNSSVQLHFLFQHPIHIVKLLVNTNLTSFANTFVQEFFGMFGYWRGQSVVEPFIFPLLWVMIVSFWFGRHLMITIRAWGRLRIFLPLLAIIGSFLLVEFTLYLDWTSVGNTHILGLMGRYFIPIALLGASGLLAFSDNDRRVGQLTFLPVSLLSLLLIVPGLLTEIHTYYQWF